MSAGTAGINISGNAATATTAASATSASTASNALSLGGVVAGDYARLDIGNSFAGNQSVGGALIASGIVSGLAPVTVTTSSSISAGTSYSSGYYFNQNSTTTAATTYTLPTAAAGRQYCFGNSYNGSAADTGTVEISTSASGQYIIWNGALSASGGYIISGGAAGDKGCVVGVDGAHWEFYAQYGVWALH
jgi:hypothetical protein